MGKMDDPKERADTNVVVNRALITQSIPLDLQTHNPDIYEDIIEIDNYDQEISDSDAEQELAFLRTQPSTLWRVEHSANAKASVIEQLYADMVHLPKIEESEGEPHRVQHMIKTTRSTGVQDSGSTLLLNRTLLLFTQLNVWIGYLFGVVLPVTRSYATQLAPEAIVGNLDIVISYLIRVLCYMYLQIKLIIQEEITRWTSVFLCAVWESLMRLSVYR